MALSSHAYMLTKLIDYTAATILDKFQNASAAQSVERVLKIIATKKAAEIMAVRSSCINHPFTHLFTPDLL